MSVENQARGRRLIRRRTDLLGFGIRTGSASKIFLLFFIAFLPLGAVAVLGVFQAVRTMEQERVARLQLSVEQRVNKLSRTIAEDRRTLLFLVDTLGNAGTSNCRRAARVLSDRDTGPIDFAVFDSTGKRLCTSAGPNAGTIFLSQQLKAQGAAIDAPRQHLLIQTSKGDDSLHAVGVYSREAIAQIIGAPGDNLRERRIVLNAGSDPLFVLGAKTERNANDVVAATASMDLGLRMDESVLRPPTSLVAMLFLMLPVILWLLTAAIAWYSVHRLLVRPLVAMQRAVATYRPGDDPEPIRRPSPVFEEINVLGETFREMAQDVSTHEQQMVESLDRQRRLTREVHHRVKNNLQIITSLVSLHSRAAKSTDAAQAYASIQRRVDALAVVHRNHFAEIEHNEGINGAALLSELASSLRGGGADIGSGFALRVDCDQLMLDQDVAMPVAFIVTELVELAIRVDANAVISLALRRVESGAEVAKAMLSVQSLALRASPELDVLSREGFERVLRGLSRQLRSELVWDGEVGRYAIMVPTIA